MPRTSNFKLKEQTLNLKSFKKSTYSWQLHDTTKARTKSHSTRVVTKMEKSKIYGYNLRKSCSIESRSQRFESD